MAMGKKVKTLMLSGGVATAPADALWTDAIDSHTFQDDVRVIGFQVGLTASVVDAAVNADHEMQAIAELSRHGVAQRAGALARSIWGVTYTAAIVAHTGLDHISAPMCFPDGHGVDLDDGEVIYLHHYGKNVGTVSFTAIAWAIVYYVER